MAFGDQSVIKPIDDEISIVIEEVICVKTEETIIDLFWFKACRAYIRNILTKIKTVPSS
jgi:hypothetical protein